MWTRLTKTCHFWLLLTCREQWQRRTKRGRKDHKRNWSVSEQPPPPGVRAPPTQHQVEKMFLISFVLVLGWASPLHQMSIFGPAEFLGIHFPQNHQETHAIFPSSRSIARGGGARRVSWRNVALSDVALSVTWFSLICHTPVSWITRGKSRVRHGCTRWQNPALPGGVQCSELWTRTLQKVARGVCFQERCPLTHGWFPVVGSRSAAATATAPPGALPLQLTPKHVTALSPFILTRQSTPIITRPSLLLLSSASFVQFCFRVLVRLIFHGKKTH